MDGKTVLAQTLLMTVLGRSAITIWNINVPNEASRVYHLNRNLMRFNLRYYIP